MTNRLEAVRFGLTATMLLLLAGCAASPVTTLPDGSVAYRIDCDGSARGLNLCFEKAGKSCGADGYTIVDPDGRRISSSRIADYDMQTIVRAYSSDKNSILVRCGS